MLMQGIERFGDKLALSRVEKKRERGGGFLRACLSPLLSGKHRKLRPTGHRCLPMDML